MKTFRNSPSPLPSSAVAAPSALRPTNSALRTPRSAFTMIEIAISLAVIGFALVAIVGILPMAMNVQKDNRQETIINQDQSIWMNAIQNGERGLDDLTNYVFAITNYGARYNVNGKLLGPWRSWYTPTDSSMVPKFPLTNGARIIGLLSTPKMIWRTTDRTYYSNHMVAFVRSMSGPASEKAPQRNPIMQDFSLGYRLISDVVPYGTNLFDPSWTNLLTVVPNTPEAFARTNYSMLVSNLQLNFHELRLTFRWPLLPNGNSGPGRQVFRSIVGGSLQETNDPGLQVLFEQRMFFFHPGNYAKAP